MLALRRFHAFALLALKWASARGGNLCCDLCSFVRRTYSYSILTFIVFIFFIVSKCACVCECVRVEFSKASRSLSCAENRKMGSSCCFHMDDPKVASYFCKYLKVHVAIHDYLLLFCHKATRLLNCIRMQTHRKVAISLAS